MAWLGAAEALRRAESIKVLLAQAEPVTSEAAGGSRVTGVASLEAAGSGFCSQAPSGSPGGGAGRCIAGLPWFVAPASAEAAQRALGEGAWCWFADPRAVRHDGSRRQDLRGLGLRTTATSRSRRTTTTASRRTTAVIHELACRSTTTANPCYLQVRPDGRLAVFYSALITGLDMYSRVSDSARGRQPNWGPAQKVSTNTAGSPRLHLSQTRCTSASEVEDLSVLARRQLETRPSRPRADGLVGLGLLLGT